MLNEREQAAHDPTIAETAQGLSLTFEKLKADISQSRAARFVLAVLEKLKGAIQMEKTLKTGKIGQFGAESRVTYGGVKWVVLDARPNMSLCLAEDVLKDENGEVRYMAFDTDNKNDFAASSVRAFLNGDFLEELAAAGADKEAFVPIVLDLTSDDGLDDYGTDSAKIGLITDQMYRAFRKIIPKASEDYWTCTPFSTERNGYSCNVRNVNTSGALNNRNAYSGYRGVRPLCALKSDILVSYDEGEVNERKPSYSGHNRRRQTGRAGKRSKTAFRLVFGAEKGRIYRRAGVRAYQGITEKAAPHDGAAYPLYIIYKKGRVQNDGI